MKKIIIAMLVMAIVLVGCGQTTSKGNVNIVAEQEDFDITFTNIQLLDSTEQSYFLAIDFNLKNKTNAPLSIRQAVEDTLVIYNEDYYRLGQRTILDDYSEYEKMQKIEEILDSELAEGEEISATVIYGKGRNAKDEEPDTTYSIFIRDAKNENKNIGDETIDVKTQLLDDMITTEEYMTK